jgi:hypothetical protein
MRQLTQKLYYDLMFDGKSFRFPIQKYGNICNQPNEYAKEAMLFCPVNGPVHAMPFPIVAHQRNRYAVVTNYGIRYLRQFRVSMQDYAADSEVMTVIRLLKSITTEYNHTHHTFVQHRSKQTAPQASTP